jgi:CheY-like chemotaxis protein
MESDPTKKLQILIADDDADAAELYRAALEARGHTVTLTFDGRECVDIYKDTVQRLASNKHSADVGPYDAVILDYKMPRIDGLEAAKEIMRINPRQRIIFASGYVKESLMESVKELKRVVELIQKPFEPDVLIELVEDTSTFSRLGDLDSLVKEMSHNDSPSDAQIDMLLQLLKKIQKSGSV